MGKHKGDMRYLLLGIRQALLIMLGRLEEYLDLPRSVPPKHSQDAG